uniref:Uncharacterized protein n=1 Tax=Enterococcus faecalis TaxID=1351 RepID=A0A1W6QWI7_ENTFL|nr:hypothetical protein [Enterococcus faecalis]
MAYLVILGTVYFFIAVILIGFIALSFPEALFFIMFSGFFSFEKVSPETLESVGIIKDIATLLQSHILPLNGYLKAFMIIVIILSYLGMNIYINFRVPVLFKIVNNYIRVVVYGILIHYIIQPELRDFFVLLLVAGSISILSRTVLFKIISRKINVESSQNKN